MRWSIEELFKDFKVISNKGFGLWYRVKHAIPSLYRHSRSLFYWIFTGHGYSTYWWLDSYLAESMIIRIKHFKKRPRMGYIYSDDIKSMEDWNNLLDKIIDGLDSYLKLDKLGDAPNNHFDFKKYGFGESINVLGFTSMLGKYSDPEVQDIYDNYVFKNDIYYKELTKKYEEALQLLSKHFDGLWD